MFGVFSAYELQVIYDWIRAGCSSDGRHYTEDHGQTHGQAVPSFRASSRLDAVRGVSLLQTPLQSAGHQLPDLDLQMLIEQFLHLDSDGQEAALLKAMAPAHHWTPTGLYATRLVNAKFCG